MLPWAQGSAEHAFGQVPREQTLRVTDLDVNPLRRRVTRGRDRIDLTVKEYVLLDYFQFSDSFIP